MADLKLSKRDAERLAGIINRYTGRDSAVPFEVGSGNAGFYVGGTPGWAVRCELLDTDERLRSYVFLTWYGWRFTESKLSGDDECCGYPWSFAGIGDAERGVLFARWAELHRLDRRAAQELIGDCDDSCPIDYDDPDNYEEERRYGYGRGW